MTPLTRPLCLLLVVALMLPTAAYPVLADEAPPSTDSSVTETSSSTSDASSSSTSATESSTDVNDTSHAESTDASSDERATVIEDTITPSGGSDSSVTTDPTTTPEVPPTESNTQSTTGDDTTASTTPATATTTPEVGGEDADATTTPPIDTIATSTSETMGTTTETGTASNTPADTTITTGDASAGANVVNVTNANFVNATGDIVLANSFGTSSGVDLRDASSTFDTGVLCVLFTCTGGGSLNLNLSGTSTIDNGLFLNATSGGNLIDTASGSAAILTGNAYAGLNLVNLANLNIVDSTYLIAALNFFQGINGDIVLPGLANFFGGGSGASAGGESSVNSTAGVVNDITFNAGTGDNTTNATSSSITSGQTLTLATLLNQLNATNIGGANLAIILRVTGTWNGQILSAPDGLSILHGDDGSIYLTKGGGAPAALAGGTFNATSTALITNHANLGAFTGGNGIFGADSALIQSGNAYAAANVLNLANQNIVGKNWITAVINIFGDWNGNLAFGRPDLVVGERVETQGAITDGTDLTFHFTIANIGDAPASAATFSASLPGDQLSATDAPRGPVALGDLAPGASTEVVIHARVHAPPGSQIVTSGTASENEPDNDGANNQDTITLATVGGGGGGGSLVSRTLASAPKTVPLTATRTTTSASVGDGTRTVHEELLIDNPNNASSTPVDLHDLLKDPSGTVVQDEAWPLPAIAPHGEVKVAYDITFDDTAPAGRYTLSTVLASDIVGDTEFKDNGSITVAGVSLLSATTTSHGGSVLGVATSTEPLVTTGTEADSRLAAVTASGIPWTYGFGFTAAFAVLIGFLWLILRAYRHTP